MRRGFFKILFTPDDIDHWMRMTALKALRFQIKFLQKEKNLKSFDLTSLVR